MTICCFCLNDVRYNIYALLGDLVFSEEDYQKKEVKEIPVDIRSIDDFFQFFGYILKKTAKETDNVTLRVSDDTATLCCHGKEQDCYMYLMFIKFRSPKQRLQYFKDADSFIPWETRKVPTADQAENTQIIRFFSAFEILRCRRPITMLMVLFVATSSTLPAALEVRLIPILLKLIEAIKGAGTCGNRDEDIYQKHLANLDFPVLCRWIERQFSRSLDDEEKRIFFRLIVLNSQILQLPCTWPECYPSKVT